MMTTTESPFGPALVSPEFDSFAVRQAMAGFLAGYVDTTREAYSLDLPIGTHRLGSRTRTVTIVTPLAAPDLPDPGRIPGACHQAAWCRYAL